jgi:hypothetical protein
VVQGVEEPGDAACGEVVGAQFQEAEIAGVEEEEL